MSSSNIRVVHDPAPEDNPAGDLHIWKPTRSIQSGLFNTPCAISDALCAFLGLPAGSKISRSEITRGIIAYVKVHGLITGQNIAQDDALRDLLGLAPDLNILSLQRYLRPHYITETDTSFEAWWTSHESPLWVGVNAEGFFAQNFVKLYSTLTRYPSVQFVVYTNLPATDAEAPCGCHGYDGVCEYHRIGDEDTAPCGCSTEFTITCEYHK